MFARPRSAFRRLTALLLGSAAIAVLALAAWHPGKSAAGPVSFTRDRLNAIIEHPTSLALGPDGRLYVASGTTIEALTLNADVDGDGCPNGKEFGPDEHDGGQRNPLNPWDYFNPTHDGENRVDDILAVIKQYNENQYLPSPPNPPQTLNPDYTAATDRSPGGPNTWNLGPPDGQQRLEDILAAITQYGHFCQ